MSPNTTTTNGLAATIGEPLHRTNILSPALVTTYKAAVLGSLAFFCPNLLSPFRLHNWLFWAVSALTSVVYLLCCWGDPGYQLECPSSWLESIDDGDGRRSQKIKRLKRLKARLAAKPPDNHTNRHTSSDSDNDGDVHNGADADGLNDDDESTDNLDGAITDGEEGPYVLSSKENFDFSAPIEIHHGGIAITADPNSVKIDRNGESDQPAPSESVHLEIELDNETSNADARTLVVIDPADYGRDRRGGPEPYLTRRAGHTTNITSRKSTAIVILIRLVAAVTAPFRLAKTGGKKVSDVVKSIFRRIGYWLLFQLRSCGVNIREWARLSVTPCLGSHSEKDSIPGASVPICQLNELITVGIDDLYQRNERMSFCTYCNHWKLLRTRHCKSCKRCVRVFDHHCPWLGVCVGECNRTLFLYYLIVQTVELLWTTVIIGNELLLDDLTWLDSDSMRIIIPRVFLVLQSFGLISLALMTCCLFTFHGILLAMNVTTWEMICWNRISYLKNREPQYGSPFGSDTLQKNCLLACLPPNILQTLLRRYCFKEDYGHKRPESDRFIWGPGNAQVWIIKERGDSDFGVMPTTLNPGCCNLYSVCI